MTLTKRLVGKVLELLHQLRVMCLRVELGEEVSNVCADPPCTNNGIGEVSTPTPVPSIKLIGPVNGSWLATLVHNTPQPNLYTDCRDPGAQGSSI
jgi:hypothetical protein